MAHSTAVTQADLDIVARRDAGVRRIRKLIARHSATVRVVANWLVERVRKDLQHDVTRARQKRKAQLQLYGLARDVLLQPRRMGARASVSFDGLMRGKLRQAAPQELAARTYQVEYVRLGRPWRPGTELELRDAMTLVESARRVGGDLYNDSLERCVVLGMCLRSSRRAPYDEIAALLDPNRVDASVFNPEEHIAGAILENLIDDIDEVRSDEHWMYLALLILLVCDQKFDGASFGFEAPIPWERNKFSGECSRRSQLLRYCRLSWTEAAGESFDLLLLNLVERCADHLEHLPDEPQHAPATSSGAPFTVASSTSDEEHREAAEERAFLREARTWTLRFGGIEETLPHSVGLKYIAILIQNAGKAISVNELHRGETECASAPPEEVADKRALKQVFDRIRNLRADRDAANERHDEAEVAQSDVELEQLQQHLRSTQGLAGRTRKMPSEAENVRGSVKNAIRRALRQIVDVHPSLGMHLTAQLAGRSGYAPRYVRSDEMSWLVRVESPHT